MLRNLLILFVCMVLQRQLVAAPSSSLPVLPLPQRVEEGSGRVPLSARVNLKTNGLSKEQTSRLTSHWKEFESVSTTSSKQHAVELVLLGKVSKMNPLLFEKSRIFKDSIGSEGYLLVLQEGKRIIAANTETGLFYGLQTLRQLKRAGWEKELFIADWPAYETRAIYDDISRGPISTVEYVKEQIRRMAELKINYLSFYIEHVVQPLSHPDFAPENGKLTIPQIKELSAYAEKFHMKLIGSFQSFGHFEKILALPQYSSMGETHSLISLLDPKAKKFLENVIGELCEAFNAPWFNVNCDETFDLNKGRSKAYIDSIGPDRFYADHLNFLYGVLKKHNKKMMMWGDVALQYPKIPDMLPDDVVYLTWEYGAMENYDSWIKPFADRKREFMVCPGILNSYRMFPDMMMARTNIRRFLEEGKANGATGAFTTVWDDGGAALFSGDWYGVYVAAEKSWNLAKAPEKTFDSRYSLTAYGTTSENYVKALFKLMELRSVTLTYNLNDLLWSQEILSQQDQELWLTNTSVLEAKRILNEAITLLEKADAKYHVEDSNALSYVINQYALMMDTRLVLAEEAKRYREAIALKSTQPEQSARLVIQSADSMKKLKERYSNLQNTLKEVWRRENQEYSLDLQLAVYKDKITALGEVEDKLRKAAALGQSALPTPEQLGLAILETPYTYFQYWLLSGPFPVEKGVKVPAFLYSENKEYNRPPIPGGIATYQGKNYRWHKYATKSGGLIHLNDYFDSKTATVAYAYCTLNVTGKDVTEAFVRVPRGTEIFCDDKLVAVISNESTTSEEQKVPLALQKGAHRFLLKIPGGESGTAWKFSMRLGNGQEVVNSKHKYQTNSKNRTYEAE